MMVQLSSSSRQASSNGGSSNMTTTIIIAVVVTLAGIVGLLVLFRLIRRCLSRKNSAPLPPIQPIAHQREVDLAEFKESKLNPPRSLIHHQSWRGSGHSYLMAPAFPESDVTSSDLSLAREFDPSNGPTPQRVDSDASLHQRALGLEAPTPAFHSHRNSPIGSDSDLGSGNSSPMRTTFPTPTSPDIPISPSSNNSHTPLYRLRDRPSSVASSYSRKSSASRIQGAPHGPYSNVNIVLPVPLAPALSSYITDDGTRPDTYTSRSRASSRVSVVDQWAGVPINRSEKELEWEKEKTLERMASYSLAHPDQPRPSTGSANTYVSSSSSHLPYPNVQRPVAAKVIHTPSGPSPSPHNSRYQDNRPPGPPPSAFRDMSSSPPPVPRIPSIYGNVADSERGRPKSAGGFEPFPFQRANSVDRQNSLNRKSVPQVLRRNSLTRPGSGYVSDDDPISHSRANSRTSSGYASDSVTGSSRTTHGKGPRDLRSSGRVASSTRVVRQHGSASS